MLNALISKSPIVVMDAGIATEDNIEWLNDNDYKYLVISRKRNQSLPDIDVVVVKNTLDHKVTTFLIKKESESELYCHSEAMERRLNSILQKSIDRFENELQKIANSISKKGGIKKYDKIQQKISRIKEKYSKVANQFSISITGDEKKSKL